MHLVKKISYINGPKLFLYVFSLGPVVEYLCFWRVNPMPRRRSAGQDSNQKQSKAPSPSHHASGAKQQLSKWLSFLIRRAIRHATWRRNDDQARWMKFPSSSCASKLPTLSLPRDGWAFPHPRKTLSRDRWNVSSSSCVSGAGMDDMFLIQSLKKIHNVHTYQHYVSLVLSLLCVSFLSLSLSLVLLCFPLFFRIRFSSRLIVF